MEKKVSTYNPNQHYTTLHAWTNIKNDLLPPALVLPVTQPYQLDDLSTLRKMYITTKIYNLSVSANLKFHIFYLK